MENFQDSNTPTDYSRIQCSFDDYWLQFDSVGIEFAYLMENHSNEYSNWWRKIESLISERSKIPSRQINISKKEKVATKHFDDQNKKQIVLYNHNTELDEKNVKFQKIIPPCNFSEVMASDISALEDVLLLRLDLLASWTSAIKEIDGVLMEYIAHLLEYWSSMNIHVTESGNQIYNKKDLFESLNTIKLLLNKYWRDSPKLMSIQIRIEQLNVELETGDKKNTINEKSLINKDEPSCMVVNNLTNFESFLKQKKSLNIVINKYKELYKNWEMYRNLVENSSEMSSQYINNESNASYTKDLSKLEKSLSSLSTDIHLAWHKYKDLIKEKHHSNEQRIFGKYPTINVLPRQLEMKSKSHVLNYKSGVQNSQIEIDIPEEKEMKFFQNKPISIQSNNLFTSSIDISHYFTKSLLPTEQQIKMVNQSQSPNPNVGNDISLIFRNSALEKSKSMCCSKVSNKVSFEKCNSGFQSNSCVLDESKYFYNTDHIKSYYLILNLPKTDKIVSIVDRKRQRQLTPLQAQFQGLCDDLFLEILDTSTNIKYNFRTAVTRRLVNVNFKNNINMTDKPIFSFDEYCKKEVHKIDQIFDPDQDTWISLKDAVNRKILNEQDGLLKINKTEFKHIFKAISSSNVRGRKINHCSIRSLPPERIIEIHRNL